MTTTIHRAPLATALSLAALTAGCTHEYRITPAYQPGQAMLPSRPICTKGESLAISVTNGSNQPLDAGVVQGGIHTFSHQFSQDPATVLAGGLTAALREGHCGTASPGTGSLSVVLVLMKAHGNACGFVSCEGVAETRVWVKLQDAAGHMLLDQQVSADVTDDCGMVFCSEEETSGLSSRALSRAVGKAAVAIGDALAKRAAPAAPVAVAPGS